MSTSSSGTRSFHKRSIVELLSKVMSRYRWLDGRRLVAGE